MDLNTAKFKLYNRSPFFGSIIFNLPVEEVDSKHVVKTLGVDGDKLYYNKKWWDSRTNKEQLGLLCHEVGHLFLGHIWRRGNRNIIAVNPTTGEQVSLWNIAGDYVINLMVENHTHIDPVNKNTIKSFALPKGCVIDNKYLGWSTEEVYEDLRKKMKKAGKGGQGKMAKAGVCDKVKWGDKGNKGKQGKIKQAKWKQIGNQAMENAKRQGNIPAGMERLFKELEPKEDWREILLDYIQPFMDDYTFNPTDRRYLEEDFMLPDIKEGQKIDWLAIAIDTSGSIGQTELEAFISEVKGILESYDKVKVKLTFCDAEATPFVALEEFDKDKIKPTGGGGTDFRPVFNMITKEDSEPLALIYFTDTYGTFPSKEPEYDTIWISSEGKQKVPFGKLLPYKI